MERSFVIIKPDAVHRGLIGEVITRFERKGLKILGLKMLQISREQAMEQYACHKGKPFYEKLVSFMTSDPVVALVVEGENAVSIVRRMVGATNPTLSDPGSIRGDYSMDQTNTVVHASDSTESVAHELPIYFKEGELFKYPHALKDWLNYPA
jgi:nucleoside-diphosphate kinase